MIPADTETAKILRGLAAPPLACVTYADGQIATDARPFLDRYMGREKLVFHNGAYDNAVFCANYPEYIPRIFDAYDRNLITDTMIREQLHDIAAGRYKWYWEGGVRVRPKYNLGAVAERYGLKGIDKSDPHRLKYGSYIGLPLEQWPPGAISYATKDAVATGYVAERQPPVVDEYRQARYAFAAYLTRCWGLRTDPARVAQYAQRLRARQQELFMKLVYTKLIKPSGQKNTAMVKNRLEKLGFIILTEKGEISIDADTCRQSGDPELKLFADYSVVSSAINREIPMLMLGVDVPIQTRFSMADSGRRRSSGPNVQNFGRGDKNDLGVRECFVPRKGMVFAQADYESLEMGTLAQVCYTMFGFSKLRDMLNAGIDPHSSFASRMTGIPYEDINGNRKKYADIRNGAKANNFGRPGGLGRDTFIEFALATYGVTVTPEDADRELQAWLDWVPEVRLYFEHIRGLEYAEKLFRYTAHGSKRVRGGCSYTAACNGYFQSLGADIACLAWWLLSRKCYVPGNILYGSRVVNMVHDELILEVPEEIGHECAMELQATMEEAAQFLAPDVRIGAPPTLQRAYSKKAEAIWHNGRLVPWG